MFKISPLKDNLMKKGEVYGFSNRQILAVGKGLVFPVAVIVRELKNGDFNGMAYDVGINNNHLRESNAHPYVNRIGSLEKFVSLHEDEFSHVVAQFERKRRVDSKLRRIQFPSGVFSYLELLKRDYGIESLARGYFGDPAGISFVHKEEQVRQIKISEEERQEKDKQNLEKRQKEKGKKDDGARRNNQQIKREKWHSEAICIMDIYQARDTKEKNIRIKELIDKSVLTLTAPEHYRILTLSDVDVLPKYNQQPIYIVSREVAEHVVNKIPKKYIIRLEKVNG